MRYLISALWLLGLLACGRSVSAPDSDDQPSALQLTRTDSTLAITGASGPLLSYRLTPWLPPEVKEKHYTRSGFVHPLYSPAGRVVTDGFPRGHTHQHGLFFAWVDTRFRGQPVDFWNQQKGSGTIVHHQLTDTITHPDGWVGFRAEHDYLAILDKDTTAVLRESWRLTARRDSLAHLIDLAIHQRALTEDTLFVRDYHYGGLAVRGAAAWNTTTDDPGPARFLTSEGLARDSVNHSRPQWGSLYGPLATGSVSVTVMGHPDNPAYPEPVRIHPVMPYFCLSSATAGAFAIYPGNDWKARYRIVVTDGPPQPEFLDRLLGEWIEN